MSIFINQSGITLYQALNPSTLPVSLESPELVLESELPARLSDINSKLNTLESKNTNISRDGDKTIIPNAVIADIGIRDNGPDSGLRVSYGSQAMLNIHASNKLVECYGAVTATNITSNNKADIEDLQSRLSNLTGVIGNVTGFTGDLYAENVATINGSLNDVIDKIQNIVRVPGTEEGDPSHTEIDGTSFQTTLDRITNVEGTLTNVSYDPIGLLTTITGKLTVGTLNGNKIGVSAEGIGYTGEAPFLPVCKANGITEIGHRIDFHLNDNTFRDYSVALENNLVNQLSVKGMDTNTYGNLELSALIVRPSSTHSCRLIANTASNMLWFNSAGVNTWVCDATSPVERWSVTRDNALIAVTRTTGMTYTPAVVEPQPAAAYTTFTNNIYLTECYANRYHTNSTSSLPINSVANVSTWGAMRIVRTGLAQNTPCGYMFGRGNDPTNMTKNLCAIYYIAPTTDITKGEIRIGIETEASTSSTNCITFDTDTKVTKFPANITAPNLTGISYADEKTQINKLNVINSIDTYNLAVNNEAYFSGTAYFSGEVNGYDIGNEFDKLTHVLSTSDLLTINKNLKVQGNFEVDGTIILTNNETWLSSIETEITDQLQSLNKKTQHIDEDGNMIRRFNDCILNIIMIGNGETEIQGKIFTEKIETSDLLKPLAITNPENESIIEFNEDKSVTCYGAITAINISTTNKTDIETIKYNLEGLSYVESLLLQSSDFTQATVLRQHLFIDLAGKTYAHQMGIRALKTDLASTQEMMLQVGKNNTTAISFVYRFNDTTADIQYRLDFVGKSAYSCKYGATSATEHEIKGNLKVFGTITENASKKITHYTMYEGELQPGCFVETTGQIFRDPNSKLSPYEDCITVVRQATSSSNKIVGVCTEIINEEVTDDYGNINQPAGKYCKYATHGDVLIKCVSAVYNVGEILIPTVNGYAKKGQQGEILDAMLNMIPRAKITSVETAEIDSESVCAFISI